MYLSKTVEDFGPVFRLGASNLGVLPSTVTTSRPAPSCQSRSICSFNSSVRDLTRKGGNWSFNSSSGSLKRKNEGGSSRGNVWSARVFVTPDSPKGFAPKSPPEQNAPRLTDEVEAPTIFVNVPADIVSSPLFFVPPTSRAREVQSPKYIPPPARSVAPGVHDSEFAMATQLGPQLRLEKDDSAAGSAGDVEDLPKGVIPDVSVLESPDKVSSSIDARKDGFNCKQGSEYTSPFETRNKSSTHLNNCKQGSEYTSPLETRNKSSTHLFPGEYWSSPVNLEATLRSRNLLPYQFKYAAGPASQRHSPPRVSPPVTQNGRTDSDSASIFGGDNDCTAVGSPLVTGNERNSSGTVPQVPHPYRGICPGLDGRGREITTAAPRPPYLKRSFSSVESTYQEETRRENLHRVESWVTKTTVFPKQTQKGSSL